MRLVGDFSYPKPGLHPITEEIRYMGQDLLNPPTVEGWHTGSEWIDSGTLVERVNFTAGQIGNVELPGVRAVIDRLKSEGGAMSSEQLVDRCLELLGSYKLPAETRGLLVAQAQKGGVLSPDSEDFAHRVGQVLRLIVSTQEYQFA